jgi:phasin
MAKNPMSYEIPNEMRDFAEKSVDQARKAFDGFLGAASKAVSAAETQAAGAQANGRDIAQKTIGYAEQNIAAGFDFAQKMVRAKDVQELMQIQAEYLKSQMAAMQSQMQEVGSAVQANVQKAASDAKATVEKATAEVQKAAAEAGRRK